jgi:sugar phosphate permease
MVPITAKIINDWFSVRLRGICSSVVAASMSVGGVIAMGLTAWLIDSNGRDIHWRVVFRPAACHHILDFLREFSPLSRAGI